MKTLEKVTNGVFPVKEGDFAHDGHSGLFKSILGVASGRLHELLHLGEGTRGGGHQSSVIGSTVY